jgi:hypothetical protein
MWKLTSWLHMPANPRALKVVGPREEGKAVVGRILVFQPMHISILFLYSFLFLVSFPFCFFLIQI